MRRCFSMLRDLRPWQPRRRPSPPVAEYTRTRGSLASEPRTEKSETDASQPSAHKSTRNAFGNSEWDRSRERLALQDEMLDAARPATRRLYRAFDMNAFAGEPEGDYTNGAEAAPDPAVPAWFPAHRSIDGFIELGSYLASSAYAVSLGGPPLPDLKYGIIVVPVGDESLLLSGYGDCCNVGRVQGGGVRQEQGGLGAARGVVATLPE